MQGPEVQAGIPPNPRRPVGRVTERILRKVWHLRVAKTGFRDLENPDNPDGPLSDIHNPRRCLGAFGDHESTAEYYRRFEHLASRFEDATDRAIAQALADGHVVQRVQDELHVGQGRIERVVRTVKAWMKEHREDDDGNQD